MMVLRHLRPQETFYDIRPSDTFGPETLRAARHLRYTTPFFVPLSVSLKDSTTVYDSLSVTVYDPLSIIVYDPLSTVVYDSISITICCPLSITAYSL